MNIETMSIGKRLRSIRKSRGLTQKQLGELLGYNSSSCIRIAQYESGRRSPSPDSIKNFSRVLNVVPDALDIPSIDGSTNLMHLLFALEEFYNLRIVALNDEVYLHINNTDIQELLSYWMSLYRVFLNGEISEQEYKEWQYQYTGKK